MAGTPIGGLAGNGTPFGAPTTRPWSGSGGTPMGGGSTSASLPKQQAGSTAGGASGFLTGLFGSLGGGGGSAQGTSSVGNLFNTAIGIGTGIAGAFGAGNFGGRPSGTMTNNPMGSYFGGGSMAGWGPPQTPAAPQAPQSPPAPPAPPAQQEAPLSSRPPAAPPTPWYGKWWVWASVVGGLAVLGTGGYFLLRKPGKAAAGLGEAGCVNPNPRYRRMTHGGRR